MRIAQVCSLHESVPPKQYGGTERVVAYLTDALMDLGHEVTVFASGDSETKARLRPMREKAIRLDDEPADPMAPHILMIEKALDEADQFDVMHFHTDYFHFPAIRRQPVPHVTTLHGRLDIGDLRPVYEEFREMPLVSISDNQRLPIPGAGWIATVYHGLPKSSCSYRPKSGDYLAFLGRFTPEKQAEIAIDIAKRAGIPIKLAAKIDDSFLEYFHESVEPLLADPQVEYIGEIDEHEKADFLGNALGLLFPINWPEPFGLVMIEAMACGTPAIAFRHGSVPEVIDEGITGFAVGSEEEAVDAVRRLPKLDRRKVFARFQERFSAERMARDYVEVYKRVMAEHGQRTPPPKTESASNGGRGRGFETVAMEP